MYVNMYPHRCVNGDETGVSLDREDDVGGKEIVLDTIIS